MALSAVHDMIDQASYQPSTVNYESLRSSLKTGLPVSSEQASKSISDSNAVSHWQLSDDELVEIDGALRYFECCSLNTLEGDISDMT